MTFSVSVTKPSLEISCSESRALRRQLGRSSQVPGTFCGSGSSQRSSRLTIHQATQGISNGPKASPVGAPDGVAPPRLEMPKSIPARHCLGCLRRSKSRQTSACHGYLSWRRFARQYSSSRLSNRERPRIVPRTSHGSCAERDPHLQQRVRCRDFRRQCGLGAGATPGTVWRRIFLQDSTHRLRPWQRSREEPSTSDEVPSHDQCVASQHA